MRVNKVFKKISSLLVCFFLMIITIMPANAILPNLYLYGEAAILVDAETGQVLFEKNAHRLLNPASLTKIMTSLIAMEHSDGDDIVTVTREALYLPSDSSAAGIEPGQQFKMSTLQYALMLPSGNDAANAIAIHISGSVEEFAKLMNEKAEELGLQSRFENPHGLTGDNHKSTAYDLAQITVEAMKYPEFQDYSGQFYVEEYELTTNEKYYLTHTHRMIKGNDAYYDPNVIAGKTGWTSDAGNCLMTVYEKDGKQLIAVVLNSDSDEIQKAIYVDTENIINYGYNNFQKHELEIAAGTLAKGDYYGSDDSLYEVSLANDGVKYSVWAPNGIDDVSLKILSPEVADWSEVSSYPQKTEVYVDIAGSISSSPIASVEVIPWIAPKVNPKKASTTRNISSSILTTLKDRSAGFLPMILILAALTPVFHQEKERVRVIGR